MYIAETIQNEFFGNTPLIGWRQEYDPDQDKIDEYLTTSTSNRFFQGQHPKLTLKSIFAIAPKFRDFVYPSWVVSEPYEIGDIVSYSSSNWRAKTQNTGVTPIEGVDWEVYTVGNQKSDWLNNKVRDYCLNVIDDWLEQKHNDKLGKSIIEERAMFDGAQSSSETIENEGKVVGFEIRTSLSLGILAKIMKIGLQFTESGPLTISLYHSSRLTPIQTQILTVDSANDAQFFDVGWDMKYLTEFDSGGAWRVEYEQNSAPGLAINKARDYGELPTYRTGYTFNVWKLWSPYLQFHPFKVDPENRNDPTKREYIYTESFGMNFLLSVGCDYTDFIVRQKSLFNNVMAKGIAVKMLNEILQNANDRVIASTLNVDKNLLFQDLNGDPKGRKTGLVYEYQKALKALNMNTNGLSRECLKCGRKGVKYKAMM